MSTQKEDDVFIGIKEVGEYLGLQPTTITYHMQAGNIAPDYKAMGNLVFRKSTLDNFRKFKQTSGGLSLLEIAEIYDITTAGVRWHIRRGNLRAKGKRGNALIYRTKDVIKIAERFDWKLRPGQSISQEQEDFPE